MQFRIWLGLIVVQLAVSSGAFLIIPPKYHGKWTVPDTKDGSFHVDADHISARFRSAELRLTPQTIRNHVLDENEKEDELFLHDVEVIRRPSTLDIRSLWRNIGYFYAVQKHGITLHTLLVDTDVVEVRWYINPKYSGKIKLTRFSP